MPQPERASVRPAGSPPSVSSPLVQPSFFWNSEKGRGLCEEESQH